jgi:large subunit ribosomal protein L14e
MTSLDIGRVCIKISGREAGKYCVVLKVGKDKESAFAWITGPKLLSGVKRRRANIGHLEPTPYKLDVKEDATDEEVISAFEKSALISKLNLKMPSAVEMKTEKAGLKEEKAKKAEKPKKESKGKKGEKKKE